MTTMSSVTLWAPVTEAVSKGQRVRMLSQDSGALITGTLRAFTREEGDPCFARVGDELASLWVRITTSGGWDVWVKALELAEQHSDGAAAFS